MFSLIPPHPVLTFPVGNVCQGAGNVDELTKGIIWRQQHDVGPAENLPGLEPKVGIMDPGTEQVLVLIIDHDGNEVVK